MTLLAALLIAAAGFAAGAVNAVAGGGSLISFPALLAVGYPSVTANVTNTVALFPGYAGSVAGARQELDGQRLRVRALGVTSVVGGVAGAAVLLTTPGEVFQEIVPFLILLACLLLAVQPWLAALVRRLPGADKEHRSALLHFAALFAAAYGAYFGAGLGVMLLALLGIFLGDQLKRINALKNVLSLVINAVALVAFAAFGPVEWPAVAVVALSSLLGGYLGARLARRIGARVLRTLVVVYGLVVAGILFVQS
ncbi:MAG: sulfite exporter TauE/SafE family protein [Actinomycetota bacterium]|nr:sulfite exporter TauE/SafE family protein [Actinomycetota bacterium]